MRRFTFLASALALCTIVSAHPGHDHASPSGVWPVHASEDSSAGLVSAFVTSEPMSPVGDGESGHPVETMVWKLANGATGTSPSAQVNANINTVLADVNTVAYDDDWVYIRTSGIPSHSIGPFNDGNPATPGDVDATYRVSRNPTEATVHQRTGLANIGVAVNGVGIFNWSDATRWNAATNQLVNLTMGQYGDWNTNALWRRMDGFDDAGGHPAGGPGVSLDQALYHYHAHPHALVEQLDPGNTGDHHSPIIGFAFDGFPIYGPYAYANGVDDSAGFIQMTSSYVLIDERPANGPDENDYELGSFVEDFEYVEGAGTLNEFNMTFVVTPEYPQGTWAYFTTFDVNGSGTTLDGDLAYPFTVGPNYFGEVDQEIIARNAVITVPNDVTYTFQYGVTQPIPGDTDDDGDIDTADITTSIQNFTGAGGSGKGHAEGDTDDDGDVDTADLTYSISNFTGAQAGIANVPDLIYDPATGNVTIDADGTDMISFSLQSGPFSAADFSDLPVGLTDNIATQIGWTSFNLFTGLTGTADLGAILPAGLDESGLEAALATASYGLALSGGGGGGRFDLIVPEPASMLLLGLGLTVCVRRRSTISLSAV